MSAVKKKTEPTPQTAPPEPYLSLSERIRLYVLEKSGGLAEIARVTGIPKTTLNPWLLGQKGITTSVLDRVCQAYQIVPFIIDGGPSEHVSSISSAVKDYDSLSRQAMQSRLSLLESRLQESGKALEAMASKCVEIEKNFSQVLKDFSNRVQGVDSRE